MIKLIVFDLDGVLFETRNLHYESLNQALEKCGEPTINIDEHLSRFDGLSTKRKLAILTKERGLSEFKHPEIWKAKQEITQWLIKSTVCNKPEVIEMITELKKKYKIWCASNAVRQTIYTVLKQMGILKLFDGISSNEDVVNNKPHPEIYMRCMINNYVSPKETLIIEDSHIGRKAAIDSGAYVLGVKGPEEVTLDRITKEIELIETGKQTKPKWVDKNLNVLIPMAGLGSRFAQVGYTFPKPLIDVRGEPMIKVVVDSLNIDANYIYIVQKEHYEKYNLKNVLNLITPNCKIIQIEGLNGGTAGSIHKYCKEYIDNSQPLVLANSDQYIDWESNEFMYSMQNVDGGILVFENCHPKWSYAKLGKDGYVEKVAEKDPISNLATCVGYHTRVKLADGTSEEIGKIVNQKLELDVLSFNIETNKIEKNKITNWIKKDGRTETWYKLSTKNARNGIKKSKRGIYITGDHKVYTTKGLKRVDCLNNNDEIITIHQSPNKKQLGLIDATLLGDSYYNKPNNKGELGRFVMKHSFEQKEWLDLKTNALCGLDFSEDIEYPHKTKHGKNNNGSIKRRFMSSPFWSIHRDRWYKNNKKIVPHDITIDSLGLAAWYMDDGSLNSDNKRCVLCTEGFDIIYIDFLREILLNNFNIKTTLQRKNKSFRIAINTNESYIFFDIIHKYIPKSMQYKLPESYRGYFDCDLWNLGSSIQFSDNIVVDNIEKINTKNKRHTRYSYCLEIENNHNFFATDLLISNCGVYYWKHGSDFYQSIEDMIAANDRVKNEFYVCPSYNYLIKKGKKIKVFKIDKECMAGLGTPEDLNYFLDNHK